MVRTSVMIRSPVIYHVRLFAQEIPRVVSSGRTDYVVTNDLSQSDVSDTQQVCRWRWKVEQFHREAKQYCIG